jgi:hypothetical protein
MTKRRGEKRSKVHDEAAAIFSSPGSPRERSIYVTSFF